MIDLIPLDFSYNIEYIISNQPTTVQLLLSSDVSTMVNTGFMIVRNHCLWIKNYIMKWLELRLLPGMIVLLLESCAIIYLYIIY